MRERLVAVLIGMTVAVVALYGVPRAYVVADLVVEQEEQQVERSLDLIVIVLTESAQEGGAVTARDLSQFLYEAESLTYVDADGVEVSVGRAPQGSDSDIVRTRELEGGGTVTLTRSGESVDDRVSGALLPIVLIGLGLIVVSAIIGSILARRLARPFQELAEAAHRVGEARFDVDIARYTVPEAEAIGTALRNGAAQLDQLMQRERELAVTASHELRTPITGLRLQLEDLTLWPQTHPDVAAQLEESMAELDRLGGAITRLLDEDRGQRSEAATEVDLAILTQGLVEDWRRQASNRGREIDHAASGRVRARVDIASVTRLLELLLEDAGAHGSGRIDVDTAELTTHLRVRVADEGARRASADVKHGSPGAADGSPVTRAAEIAESLGGYLVVDDVAHHRLVLMLPKTREDSQSLK